MIGQVLVQNLQTLERAKHDIPAFSRLLLIDSRRFIRDGDSQGAEHYGEAQNFITSCFSCQTGSPSIFLPVID